jgi:regulatory protein
MEDGQGRPGGYGARKSTRRRDHDAGSSGRSPESRPGPPPDPVAAAREICLRLLTVRPRSRAELAKALERRRVDGAVVEAVLGRLTDVGLIDDVAFAEAYVASRQGRRALGRRAITHQLGRRGVDQDVAAAAVSAIDSEAELAAARELVAIRLRGTEGQPPPVRARRAAGMLARRGYPPGIAARAVREALELDEEFDLVDPEPMDT